MHSYTLNIFELELVFKTEADPARVENACAYARKLYEVLKLQGNYLGRDKLLALVILALADDLLQLRQQTADREERVAAMLQRIEKKEQPPGSCLSGQGG
jgi:cell division protein ZapA (FtsZ GTPase activity inhibitor)